MQGSVMGLFAAKQGGVPKPPVSSLQVLEQGCVGDKQNDTKHHGGPNRAVCIFSIETLEQLNSEGHPIFPGSVGENVLVQDIPWDKVGIGTQFHFEHVILEVTGDAPPCKTIKASFLNEEFKRISVKIHPGSTRWYAKVLQSGELFVGEQVKLS